MSRWLATAGLISIIELGCAHAAPQASVASPIPPAEARFAQSAKPPGWVNALPQEKNALYAVGISGPTFFADDAIKYASDNARVELGRAISSHVTSAFLAVESTDGSYADQASVVNATHDYSDTIMQNSEIIATWVDRTGSYSGSAGTTYALARLDLAKIKLGPPPPKAAPAAGASTQGNASTGPKTL